MESIVTETAVLLCIVLELMQDCPQGYISPTSHPFCSSVLITLSIIGMKVFGVIPKWTKHAAPTIWCHVNTGSLNFRNPVSPDLEIPIPI